MLGYDLIDAVKRFQGDDHSLAVASWLLGIVCWQMGGTAQWEAISHWEGSYLRFIELREDSHQPKDRSNWYSDRRK